MRPFSVALRILPWAGTLQRISRTLGLPGGVQRFGECARADSAGEWRRTAFRDARLPTELGAATIRLGCDRVEYYGPDSACAPVPASCLNRLPNCDLKPPCLLCP